MLTDSVIHNTIYSKDPITIDPSRCLPMRFRGHRCKECVRHCRYEAISFEPSLSVHQTRCTGCMLCMEACPQYPNSPIRYNEEKHVCIKCDLCGGDPLCVKFCPKSVDLTHISPNIIPEEDRVLKFVRTDSL